MRGMPSSGPRSPARAPAVGGRGGRSAGSAVSGDQRIERGIQALDPRQEMPREFDAGNLPPAKAAASSPMKRLCSIVTQE